MTYRDDLEGSQVALEKPTRPVGRRAEVSAARVETKADPATKVNAGVVLEKAVKSRRVEIDNVYILGGEVVAKPTSQQRQNITSSWVADYGFRAKQSVTLAAGAGRG